MKQSERFAGLGGGTRQLHHKYYYRVFLMGLKQDRQIRNSDVELSGCKLG